MIYLILVVVLFAVMFLPQFATRQLLEKHSVARKSFPGTGGQFAQHLIERFSIDGVSVESTPKGDHYDPATRTVRLTPEKLEGKSLTAVVVAAHEVGHAIQHHTRSRALRLRTWLAQFAQFGAIAAQIGLVASPILVGVSPGLARMAIVMVVVGILLSTVVHLITLPVEWDASFNKAMPILREGDYLSEQDLVDAKRILTACAFTYVSASLGSLLGLLRWVRWIR